MLRQLGQFVLLCGLVAGGSYGLYRYEQNRSAEAKLREQIRQLEEQRQHLRDFVARLTSEKRVAEIVVADQLKEGDRITQTTLMFVEYGRDGKQLPPKFFTIKGHCAHIDALVIKFDRGFMENDDPLRGHSLVLFYRLYGDYQPPADGFRIDDPGKAPAAYQGDAEQSIAARQFEAELWQNFWKLADDEAYRKEKGVRVAQGESPWTYFYPDRVYTLTLEAAGGLSITSKPMEGIWQELREALKR